MDRRELFKTLAGAAAAVGAPATLSAYDAAPGRPALFVLETPHEIAPDSVDRLVRAWESAIARTPFEGVKVIVLGYGMKLHALAADGTVLNREQTATPKRKRNRGE